jgi:peptide/nickel transport system ATP-binding protein/oligopeptide transport system ATP-binding protein
VERDLLSRPTSWLWAVDGVDLDIHAGETLAVVGESGSGKSTLARLILRLIEPTAGTVSYDGLDVLNASERQLRSFRQRAQIVFQDPYSSLDPRMTVAKIVSEGMSHLQLDRSARSKRLSELLDLVHLPQRSLTRYPHEFSGGQRQRISLARALAVGPAFLIADEPVSALDVSVQSHMLNLLQDLQEQLNLTYLFISHDMSVVRHAADRVAVMYLGKVVEIAPTHELFTNPLHPYTQALLSSVPSLVREPGRERIALDGEVPSPIDPGEHCRFASRCFRSKDVCHQQVPPLEPVGAGRDDHRVACFNAAPLPS